MVENQGLRGQKDDPTALKKALEREEATLRELVALTRSKPEGDEEDQYRHAEHGYDVRMWFWEHFFNHFSSISTIFSDFLK